MVLGEDELASLCAASDWLPLARRVIERQTATLIDSGHVLTLFDAAGRMLHAEGDPHALDSLRDIHFMPGALWNEDSVGTNGPGTALATGRPVHVIGAEHFCLGWHAWHCAALPLHDPASGEIIGALDVSGDRDRVHPFALRLAAALGLAIEQALEARHHQRRGRLLTAFAELTARHPGQPIAAVDIAGQVLCASPSVPADLLPLAKLGGPPHVGLAEGAPRFTAVPVYDGERAIGSCLILSPPSSSAVSSRRERPTTATATRARVRYSFADLVGECPRLREAARIARAAADNQLPVLVLGESGVGKEVIAQSIHAASARAMGPFVAVNCASLPRELLESELFGYVGGAFSGARAAGSAGKFEAADGGTLFLDEILELTPAAQAALLRVLQEGEITRVGANRSHPVDVRVIAATNHDLAAALAAGTLRRDLYHRINVLTVELPALRERTGDLAALVARFLADAQRETGRHGITVAPEVMVALEAHSWPGNLRELKNLLRGAVATCRDGQIGLHDLPAGMRHPVAPAPPSPVLDGEAARTPGALDGMRARVVAVVEAARTMSEAAARLGIDRSTLYRQLERYGLRRKKTLSRE